MKHLKFGATLLLLMIGGLFVVAQSQTPQQPAPIVDRIGFPVGYQDTYKLLLVFDRPDNGQIRVIYGNDVAASVQPGEPYPYGSILIFESWTSKRDAQNNILLDENGRFIRNTLTTIFVQRKERGFGKAYQQIRNGEWEYVAYNPNGGYVNRPDQTAGCATCHLQVKDKDYVYRTSNFLQGASGAVPDAVLFNYRFVPGTMRVKAGSVITFYNTDEFDHTIANMDRSFDSGVLHPGGSYTLSLKQPGQINYQCTIHPNMRGAIIVE